MVYIPIEQLANVSQRPYDVDTPTHDSTLLARADRTVFGDEPTAVSRVLKLP
jgi:hypothetical protein